jgi:pimeloyl-ACP methyl ester carboxylesterase
MRLRTDDGIALHVQELGEGPPVVLLHGLLVGNMTTWYWTAAPELAKSHRVILFDLRGHGLSERARTGYDVARMSRDLESVIGLESGPVALVGHSFGALVALSFALRRPESVSKVVVVEAPLPPSKIAELQSFLTAAPDAMLEALPRALRTMVGNGGRRTERFADTLAFLVKESSLLDDLRAAEDIPDDALASLRAPLLAVYGSRSSCRPVGERLARVVPGARLVELDGGHFLPIEAPRAVADVLAEFLHG